MTKRFYQKGFSCTQRIAHKVFFRHNFDQWLKSGSLQSQKWCAISWHIVKYPFFALHICVLRVPLFEGLVLWAYLIDFQSLYSFGLGNDGAITGYVLAYEPCTSGHVTLSWTSGLSNKQIFKHKALFHVQSGTFIFNTC